jgi:hypothetical protein
MLTYPDVCGGGVAADVMLVQVTLLDSTEVLVALVSIRQHTFAYVFAR